MSEELCLRKLSFSGNDTGKTGLAIQSRLEKKKKLEQKARPLNKWKGQSEIPKPHGPPEVSGAFKTHLLLGNVK